jgi:hypothetical protein
LAQKKKKNFFKNKKGILPIFCASNMQATFSTSEDHFPICILTTGLPKSMDASEITPKLSASEITEDKRLSLSVISEADDFQDASDGLLPTRWTCGGNSSVPERVAKRSRSRSHDCTAASTGSCEREVFSSLPGPGEHFDGRAVSGKWLRLPELNPAKLNAINKRRCLHR